MAGASARVCPASGRASVRFSRRAASRYGCYGAQLSNPRENPISSPQRCCSSMNGYESNGIRPTSSVDLDYEGITPVAGARRLSVTGTTADGTMLTSKDLATLTARDMMVSPAFSLLPETEVTTAMAFLVEHGLSGVPVTDMDGKVLGVVSGYDLLALDCTPGKLDRSFFPPVNTCINEFGGDRKMMWSNFKQLRQNLKKADGKTVEEAMHRQFEIGPEAPMEDAADMVVRKRAHRICVVDSDGVLLGVISRGDIMRATIATFQAYMEKQDAKGEAQQTLSDSN